MHRELCVDVHGIAVQVLGGHGVGRAVTSRMSDSPV